MRWLGWDGEMCRVEFGYSQCDVLQLLSVGADVCDSQACGGGHCVGDLGAGEGEEQEEGCADEFACCCLDGASVVDEG